MYKFNKIGHKIGHTLGHIMYRYSFVWKRSNVAKPTLVLSIRLRSRKCRLSTKISEEPSTFNMEAQRFGRSNKNCALLNEQLSSWEAEISKLCRTADIEGWSLERLADAAALIINANQKNLVERISNDVIAYYAKWAEGKVPGKVPTRPNKYHYNCFVQYYKEKHMRQRPAFEDVDYAYLSNFSEWLQGRGLKKNTVASHIKDLKAVINSAARFGLHNSNKANSFHAQVEEVDNIRLTTQDIEKIKAYKTDNDMMARVRDLFLLGIFTAMRFSDYSNLSVEDIKDKKVIVKRQQKTKNIVSIPITPITREIIMRYGGAPKINQVVFNRKIKVLCMEAGITDKVPIMVSGKTSYVYKYTRVSSHTARRTAAYQLVKSGENIYNVMRLLGHKSVQTTLRYIGISNEENAEMIGRSEFFKLAK